MTDDAISDALLIASVVFEELLEPERRPVRAEAADEVVAELEAEDVVVC